MGWRAVGLAVRFAFSDVITGALLPQEIVGLEGESYDALPDEAVAVTDLDDDSEVADLAEELDAEEVET